VNNGRKGIRLEGRNEECMEECREEMNAGMI
jgi:hypothetical protein